MGYMFVVWDDRDYVTANPHIRDLGWSTIRWAFTSTYAANWHPLTWLSHALDYQLFALNPVGHHLDSVLIHALNVVLLFLLLEWATRRVGPSLLVAALFAVHPLNVESVAWVAERKDVLSTLFFFLAIAAYVRYTQKPDWRRYVLVASLFAAGLMAKPMVITLPFVLFLMDYWPLRRASLERTESDVSSLDGGPRMAWSRLALEKIPLLLLSAASAWVTVQAQRSGKTVRSLHQFPLSVRIENAVVAYGLYLWKMVWPARLAALYPHPSDLLPTWQVTLSALFLAGITALVLVFRRNRYLPVGWFWFLGTLVPVIGLVQVGEAAMADRYAYIPLIGIFVIIAWTLDDWAMAGKVPTAWRVVPALCVLIALGFVTSKQMSYWESEYAVWAHTVEVTERNPGAHVSLAAALLHPDVAMTEREVQNFDTDQKRMDAARQHYEDALGIYRPLAKQNPEAYLFYLAGALSNFGNLDGIENRRDDQRRHYEEALQFDRQLALQDPAKYLPYLEAMLYNLGNLDLRQNRTDDARRHYEEALRIQSQLRQEDPLTYSPEVARTLDVLGNLDGAQNRVDRARQHFEDALEIYRQLAQQDPSRYEPYLAMTQYSLGMLELQQNRADEARQHFEEALKSYGQLAQQDAGTYQRYVDGITSILKDLDRKRTASKEPTVPAPRP